MTHLCTRCGEKNCFGGCIPFGPSEDGPDFKYKFHEKGYSVGIALEDSKLRATEDYHVAKILMKADRNNIRCIDSEIEFKGWWKQFNSEFKRPLSGSERQIAFEAWMAARGWKV